MSRSDNQDFLDKMVDHLRAPQSGTDHLSNGNGNGRHLRASADAPTDEMVIEKCRGAKNAAKFADLFDQGDVHTYNGGDDSAADLALLGILKFYTRDAEQLERLFSASALGRREKWRDRSNYRRPTIEKVLSNPGEVYDWNRKEGRRPLVSSPEPPRGDDDSDDTSETTEAPTGTGTGTPNSNGTGSGRRRLASTAFLDMPAPEPRRYLVEGIVPEAYPTLIYGDGGVAKSMLA